MYVLETLHRCSHKWIHHHHHHLYHLSASAPGQFEEPLGDTAGRMDSSQWFGVIWLLNRQKGLLQFLALLIFAFIDEFE